MTSFASKKVGLRTVIFALVLIVAVLFFAVQLIQKRPDFSAHAQGIEASSVPATGGERTAFDPADMFGLAKASYSAELYKASDHQNGSAPSQVKEPSDNGEEEEEVLSFLTPETEKAVGSYYVNFCSITAEEYNMLLFCVDHEARGGSVKHKTMVTQVILNRVSSPRFPNTLDEVLNTPGQFDVMPWYADRGEWVADPGTVEAVNTVLSGLSEDLVPGALFFCNPYIVGEGNWFDTQLEVVAEIEGHRFYR